MPPKIAGKSPTVSRPATVSKPLSAPKSSAPQRTAQSASIPTVSRQTPTSQPRSSTPPYSSSSSSSSSTSTRPMSPVSAVNAVMLGSSSSSNAQMSSAPNTLRRLSAEAPRPIMSSSSSSSSSTTNPNRRFSADMPSSNTLRGGGTTTSYQSRTSIGGSASSSSSVSSMSGRAPVTKQRSSALTSGFNILVKRMPVKKRRHQLASVVHDITSVWHEELPLPVGFQIPTSLFDSKDSIVHWTTLYLLTALGDDDRKKAQLLQVANKFHLLAAIEFVMAVATFRDAVQPRELADRAKLIAVQYFGGAKTTRRIDVLTEATVHAMLDNVAHAQPTHFDSAVASVLSFIAVRHWKDFWPEFCRIFDISKCGTTHSLRHQAPTTVVVSRTLSVHDEPTWIKQWLLLAFYSGLYEHSKKVQGLQAATRYRVDNALEFVLAAAQYRVAVAQPRPGNVVEQAKRVVGLLPYSAHAYIDDETHKQLVDNVSHANIEYFDDAVAIILEYIAVTRCDFWHEVSYIFALA